MKINPLDHGATGDGTTLNTEVLQSCIDTCHLDGGGTLDFPAGVFVTGTLRLRSKVTLHLGPGTVLAASPNLEDFPNLPSKYPAYTGELVTHKTLLLAEDAENISITGQGTIDGGGLHWKEGPFGSPSFSVRPRIIYFRHCKKIKVRDVTMINGASWIQTYQSCSDVLIDGITIDSNENPDIERERHADRSHLNTDGIDIVDSQQVRISNCFISTGDDGICLKSLSPDETCRDITVTNCVVTTNASGIKIGTESAGAFEDITITNCTVYDTRCEGISILTTDGARIERVIVSNICLRNIKGGPIAVILGNRHRSYRKGYTVEAPGVLSDVLIQNIMGTKLHHQYACSIVGHADAFIRRVTMDNISLTFDGGQEESPEPVVPEKSSEYPGGRMFGPMPVSGLFARYVDKLNIHNFQIRSALSDGRQTAKFEEVTHLQVSHSPEVSKHLP